MYRWNSKTSVFFISFWVALLAQSSVWAAEISGNIALEYRGFVHESLMYDQEGSDASISGQMEFFHDWDDGNQNLLISPFFRADSVDENRTHFDFRDLYWVTIHDSWEFYAGVRKIFWGVTESQHLVDVINQTDLVENPSGEEKLGQPMLNLSLSQDWGTVDFFVLTGFRERVFPGEDSRFALSRPDPKDDERRISVEVDNDQVLYEDDVEAGHIDFAARSFHTIDDLELGFSFFAGTNRNPELLPGYEDENPKKEVVYVPYYGQSQQFGLEMQWLVQDWIFKMEGITRQQTDAAMLQKEYAKYGKKTDFEDLDEERYTAYTTGFEYTLTNFQDTGIDWGALLEFLYDDRAELASTPFQNDVFVGTRLTFNDEQSTDFLLGRISDTEHSSVVWNAQGSRRIGDSFKVTVEGSLYRNIDEEDTFLYGSRENDFLKLEMAYFF